MISRMKHSTLIVALSALLASCQQAPISGDQMQLSTKAQENFVVSSSSSSSTNASVQFSFSQEGPYIVYRNDTFGYEIRFLEEKVLLVPGQVFSSGTEGNPSFGIRDGGHFALGVWDNPQKLSPKEWLDERYSGYSGFWRGKFEEFNDLPIKAYRAYDEYIFDPKAPTYIEHILIPKGEKMYTLFFEINAKSRDPSLRAFRDVVRTFLFLND